MRVHKKNGDILGIRIEDLEHGQDGLKPGRDEPGSLCLRKNTDQVNPVSSGRAQVVVCCPLDAQVWARTELNLERIYLPMYPECKLRETAVDLTENISLMT